jgi:tetratricopeptide (TPR) repeat protein
MPRRRLHAVFMPAAALLLALPLAAQQQSSAPPQSSTTQQTDTKQTKKKKKESKENPPAAPNPQTAPAAPVPQRGTSTADQNPFPEAQSEKAAREARQQNPTNQDSSSSAVPGLRLPTKSSKQPAPVLNTSLGRQDTKVGDFYLQSGDWKGAYSRFLEATQVDPGDAEAVYGLAEAARHLGNRKIAIQNFQLYLTALPNGPRAKDARKALRDMSAQP